MVFWDVSPQNGTMNTEAATSSKQWYLWAWPHHITAWKMEHLNVSSIPHTCELWHSHTDAAGYSSVLVFLDVTIH